MAGEEPLVTIGNLDARAEPTDERFEREGVLERLPGSERIEPAEDGEREPVWEYE